MVAHFVEMGMPPETKWHGKNGTASQIQKAMGPLYPKKVDLRPIKATLEAFMDCHKEGKEFTGLQNEICGRQGKLTPLEAEICMHDLRAGTGLTQTTFNINEYRKQHGKYKEADVNVTRQTVANTVKRLFGAKCTRRGRVPAGSRDKESTWAKVRYTSLYIIYLMYKVVLVGIFFVWKDKTKQ